MGWHGYRLYLSLAWMKARLDVGAEGPAINLTWTLYGTSDCCGW